MSISFLFLDMINNIFYYSLFITIFITTY